MLGPRLAGLIDQTVRPCAGQVAGVEDLLLEEIQRADLLHLDETPWRENGELLWLWVFNAVTTGVYFIGPRGAEIFINALQGPFRGGLMSDGYAVYRSYLNRIRCLAHLLRQARGWAESTCRQSSQVGQQLLDLLGGLILAARECPAEDLAEQQPPALAQLKAWCELHPHSPLAKLGEFCREQLNDWEAIVRPLLNPSLPLTHNAAERLLRHWVIARRLSFGTRSEQGTRAVALLARVIDTCRALHPGQAGWCPGKQRLLPGASTCPRARAGSSAWRTVSGGSTGDDQQWSSMKANCPGFGADGGSFVCQARGKNAG